MKTCDDAGSMANACVENDYDEQSGVITHAVIGDPSPGQINDAVEWRIVAPSLVEFGRSRQYAAVADQHPFEIRVFGSMPSAKRWLAED